MSFNSILGQGQAKHIIAKALQHGSLPHAYLFYGPESIGKRLLARELAKALNCTEQGPANACDRCVSCTKTEQNIHPDLFLLAPVKSTPTAREAFIRIEAIRDLQSKLGYLPYEGRTKVAIIDGVEQMNLHACNSFLKTLEEPPSSTVLILITARPNRLLPTLVSRCQGIRFHPLPPDSIKQILLSHPEAEDMDTAEIELRVLRSQGQVNRALDENVAAIAQQRQDLIALLEHLSWDRIDLLFQWSKALARDKDRVTGVLEELMGLLRDIAFLKTQNDSDLLSNRDVVHLLRPLVGKKSLAGLLKFMDGVQQTLHALAGNANIQLSLENMFLQYCETV